MERRIQPSQPESQKSLSKWEPFYDRDRDPNYQAGMRFQNLYTGPYATSLNLNRQALERFSALADLPPIHLRNGMYQRGGQRPDVNADGSATLKTQKFRKDADQAGNLWSVRYVGDHWIIDIDGARIRDQINASGSLSRRQEKVFTYKFNRLLRKSLLTVLNHDKLGALHSGDLYSAQKMFTMISGLLLASSATLNTGFLDFLQHLEFDRSVDLINNSIINRLAGRLNDNSITNLRKGYSMLLPPLPIERWYLGRLYLDTRRRLVK